MHSLASWRPNFVHSWRVHPHPFARGPGHLRDQPHSRTEALGLGRVAIDMKPLLWGGILFIVLGGFALAYQGFTYTHREKILDVGPIHASADKHERVYISPILGGLALVGGIFMLTAGLRKTA